MKKDLAIRLSHRDIIFENEDYIAVNKKRGWPVHQTLDPNRPNLFSALKSYLKNRQDDVDTFLTLPHRLDVDTSGIVVFCKSDAANKVMTKVFEQREGKKIYRALCLGIPKEKTGEWQDFLQKEKIKGIEMMTKVAKGGQKAITNYRLIESYQQGNYCQLELELITGRMHQIRVQASLAGTPLIGDPLYGNKDFNLRFNCQQQLLHACHFEFFDTISNQLISIAAPVPDDFLQWQKDLENSGPTLKESGGKEFKYILFNKPYDVLCQFTSNNPDERTLADFDIPANVYPVGRLDKDSEGLLLLTDDGSTKDRLANPKFEKEKTYWAQVEKIPSLESLKTMASGLDLGDFRSRPCKVRLLDQLEFSPIKERVPPIRKRLHIPTCWIEIILTEGKNRQVRRMTAAIWHPTLRLIRVKMDGQALDDLAPGNFRAVKKF